MQFRTKDWPGYRDFNNYARVALFPEHLRPADPQSPGVINFVQTLVSEAVNPPVSSKAEVRVLEAAIRSMFPAAGAKKAGLQRF